MHCKITSCGLACNAGFESSTTSLLLFHTPDRKHLDYIGKWLAGVRQLKFSTTCCVVQACGSTYCSLGFIYSHCWASHGRMVLSSCAADADLYCSWDNQGSANMFQRVCWLDMCRVALYFMECISDKSRFSFQESNFDTYAQWVMLLLLLQNDGVLVKWEIQKKKNRWYRVYFLFLTTPASAHEDMKTTSSSLIKHVRV